MDHMDIHLRVPTAAIPYLLGVLSVGNDDEPGRENLYDMVSDIHGAIEAAHNAGNDLATYEFADPAVAAAGMLSHDALVDAARNGVDLIPDD